MQEKSTRALAQLLPGQLSHVTAESRSCVRLPLAPAFPFSFPFHFLASLLALSPAPRHRFHLFLSAEGGGESKGPTKLCRRLGHRTPVHQYTNTHSPVHQYTLLKSGKGLIHERNGQRAVEGAGSCQLSACGCCRLCCCAAVLLGLWGFAAIAATVLMHG